MNHHRRLVADRLALLRCELCPFVAVDVVQLDVDHVVSRGEGGEDIASNLQVICACCHRLKTKRDNVSIAAHKKSKGERLGCVPRGHKVDDSGHLVVNEREAIVIKRARELRGKGYTLAVVTSVMAEEGHVTRRGRPYALSSIAHMCKVQYLHVQPRCPHTVTDDDGDPIATCVLTEGHDGKCAF